MNFSDFMQRLFSALSEGKSIPVFMRDMLVVGMDNQGIQILDDLDDETLKGYYYGHTGIGKFAKKVVNHIEPEEVISFYDKYSDKVADSIVKAFEDGVSDISSFNYAERIADLYMDILRTAAAKGSQRKRKKTSGKEPEVEVFDFGDEDTDSNSENQNDHSKEETKNVVQIIEHQTNVIQNGENNSSTTINGDVTINF
jgi:dihydropteroate synthase